MGMARRTFLTSALGSAVAPALLRRVRADTPPITLKLHHAFSAVSAVHDKFLVPWARKVESESGGRLRIDLFPSMQLGGAPATLFDQARDGSADIVWAAPSLTPGRFAKIETFELPFLSSRRALVSSKALTEFATANLQDEFRDFYPICFSCSDSAVIHATKPIHTPEDLKNFRLHVQTRFAAEAMRALGAHPVLMANAQLPAAITEHVIDGCLDPWHLVPPLRLNDLLRSHTDFSDRTPSARTYVLAMNKATYDRLPRELKSVIDSNSGQVAAAMAGAMWDLQAAAVANMVVERGDLIVTLLPETVARWRKATEPVVDAWRKEAKEQRIDGGKLIAAVNLLLAKYANEPEPQSSQTLPARQQSVAEPVQPPAPSNPTPKPNTPQASASPSTARPMGSPAQRQPPQPPAQAATAAPVTVSPAAPAPPLAPSTVTSAPATAAHSSAVPASSVAKPLTSSTMGAPTSAPPNAPPIAPVPAPAPGAAPAVSAAPPGVANAPPPAAILKPIPKTLDIRL